MFFHFLYQCNIHIYILVDYGFIFSFSRYGHGFRFSWIKINKPYVNFFSISEIFSSGVAGLMLHDMSQTISFINNKNNTGPYIEPRGTHALLL